MEKQELEQLLTTSKIFVPRWIEIGNELCLTQKGDWILNNGEKYLFGSGDRRIINSYGWKMRGEPQRTMLEMSEGERKQINFDEMRKVDFCYKDGVFVQWFFE